MAPPIHVAPPIHNGATVQLRLSSLIRTPQLRTCIITRAIITRAREAGTRHGSDKLSFPRATIRERRIMKVLVSALLALASLMQGRRVLARYRRGHRPLAGPRQGAWLPG